MSIKYGTHDLVKRIINWHEVEKVIYNGNQIRPSSTPPTPTPTYSWWWDFSSWMPFGWGVKTWSPTFVENWFMSASGTTILSSRCILGNATKIRTTMDFSCGGGRWINSNGFCNIYESGGSRMFGSWCSFQTFSGSFFHHIFYGGKHISDTQSTNTEYSGWTYRLVTNIDLSLWTVSLNLTWPSSDYLYWTISSTAIDDIKSGEEWGVWCLPSMTIRWVQLDVWNN